MSSIDAVGEMHRATAQTAYQAPAGWNHCLSEIGCFEQRRVHDSASFREFPGGEGYRVS
jgi:hypothetical protein